MPWDSAPPEYPPRPQRGGRLLLDELEVVTALAHRIPQRGVRDPGLFRGRGGLGPLGAQFGRDGDQVLEDVGRDPGPDLQLRQAQLPVGRVLLRVGQRDLELCAAARRLLAEQVRHRDP